MTPTGSPTAGYGIGGRRAAGSAARAAATSWSNRHRRSCWPRQCDEGRAPQLVGHEQHHQRRPPPAASARHGRGPRGPGARSAVRPGAGRPVGRSPGSVGGRSGRPAVVAAVDRHRARSGGGGPGRPREHGAGQRQGPGHAEREPHVLTGRGQLSRPPPPPEPPFPVSAASVVGPTVVVVDAGRRWWSWSVGGGVVVKALTNAQVTWGSAPVRVTSTSELVGSARRAVAVDRRGRPGPGGGVVGPRLHDGVRARGPGRRASSHPRPGWRSRPCPRCGGRGRVHGVGRVGVVGGRGRGDGELGGADAAGGRLGEGDAPGRGERVGERAGQLLDSRTSRPRSGWCPPAGGRRCSRRRSPPSCRPRWRPAASR